LKIEVVIYYLNCGFAFVINLVLKLTLLGGPRNEFIFYKDWCEILRVKLSNPIFEPIAAAFLTL